MSDVIAILTPSPIRRAAGLTGLGVFGALMVWLALAEPPESLALRGALLALGAGALALADWMRRASRVALELTRSELREAGGRVVARLEDVRSVAHGPFAVKPAGGFRLRLEAPAAAAWAPGLWWRLGRHVGVGGVTGKTEGRIMAETIAALTAGRRR